MSSRATPHASDEPQAPPRRGDGPSPAEQTGQVEPSSAHDQARAVVGSTPAGAAPLHSYFGGL